MATSVGTTAVGYLGATGGALAVGAVATGGVAVVGAVALGGISVPVGIIGYVAFCYARSKGKERGIEYQHLKSLSDALNTNQLLTVFKTYRDSMNCVSCDIDKTLKLCDEHFEKRITQ